MPVIHRHAEILDSIQFDLGRHLSHPSQNLSSSTMHQSILLSRNHLFTVREGVVGCVTCGGGKKYVTYIFMPAVLSNIFQTTHRCVGIVDEPKSWLILVEGARYSVEKNLVRIKYMLIFDLIKDFVISTCLMSELECQS